MPSHHFEGVERPSEQPPWGTEERRHEGPKGTTYGWMFQGMKGLPAKTYRNNTTNHFDPQNWRNKSSYQETFFTPQAFSRHNVHKFTQNRNHRPHPKELIWPLEPYKGYMIWNPKTLAGDDRLRNYSAPSLLRQYHDNKWKTTTQTTYQNYFEHDKQMSKKQQSQSQQSERDRIHTEQQNRDSRLDSRSNQALTTPPHMRTSYKLTFTGELTKPSTNAKPSDMSWRNIRY